MALSLGHKDQIHDALYERFRRFSVRVDPGLQSVTE